METPTVDAPLVIASFLILVVLISSAVLWIRQVQRPRDLISPDQGVASWSIGWVNFGIFICAMVIAVFFAQQIGLALLLDPDAGVPELTPWLAVASVILLQGPMIAVFYLARRFYPNYYADRLSRVSHGFGESFLKAVPIFIMSLPLIWIATLIWSSILTGLQGAGLIEEFAPQELVTLFQSGGDWTPIILLVMMAVIVAPIVEEVIFRGCIYRFLKSQTTLLGAQFISGAVFAMLHGNLLSFVPLVLVGVLLARAYEKTGSLAVAIWFHAFFNAFSLLMLFITGMSESLPPDY
ncbi:MAG: lysostaphin resistance A-like protein [Opitutales bacterium]